MDNEVSRKEHLEWCKSRALEYCDRGDITNALASFLSDLNKNPDTENHPAAHLLAMQVFTGFIKTPEEMRRKIEGFN